MDKNKRLTYIVPTENNNRLLSDFLVKNIPNFIVWDEWDIGHNVNELKLPPDEFLIIMTYTQLDSILHLREWLDKVDVANGTILLIQHLDNSCNFLKTQLISNNNNVFIHQDAKLEIPNPQTVSHELSVFASLCTNQFPVFTNLKRTYDFLLTTITRPSRPHRQLLVNELNSHGLITNGLTSINNVKTYHSWKGISVENHNHKDFQIAWDLYDQCNFEIVPETLHDAASFITEKTIKPIVYKMPFVVLSNQNFYKDFKELGFKTFNSLIDESFAYEPNLEIRISKLANTIESIITNGSQKFYDESKDICEYNYAHLAKFAAIDKLSCYNDFKNFFVKIGAM